MERSFKYGLALFSALAISLPAASETNDHNRFDEGGYETAMESEKDEPTEDHSPDDQAVEYDEYEEEAVYEDDEEE